MHMDTYWDLSDWFSLHGKVLQEVAGIRLMYNRAKPNYSVRIGNKEWVGYTASETFDVIENLLMWGEA